MRETIPNNNCMAGRNILLKEGHNSQKSMRRRKKGIDANGEKVKAI